MPACSMPVLVPANAKVDVSKITTVNSALFNIVFTLLVVFN